MPMQASGSKTSRLRRYRLGLKLTTAFSAEGLTAGQQRLLRPSRSLPSKVIGAGWHIAFEPGLSPPEDAGLVPVYPEAILYACNVLVAQRVAMLVYAAHCVLEGSIPMSWFIGFSPYRARPFDESELDDLEPWLAEGIKDEQVITQTTDIETGATPS